MANQDQLAEFARILNEEGTEKAKEFLDKIGGMAERPFLSDGYPDSDKGNAARFEDYAQNRVKFVEEWDCWAIYRNGCWIRDSNNAKTLNMFTHMARGIVDKATANSDAKLLKLGQKCEDTYPAKAALDQAKGRTGLSVSFKDFNKKPYLLNVRNGTLDLRTGELEDHRPADLLMQQAPVDFDPEATAPIWEACLETWHPDPEVRDYLQVTLGTGILGLPVKHLFVHYGPRGDNGKSKFFQAISYVLGPYAVQAHNSLIVKSGIDNSDRFTSDLFGARLMVCSETGVKDGIDESLVKKLTGDDPLIARKMRENPWAFDPTHSVFMHTNHDLQITSNDEAIKGRMKKITWDVKIPAEKQDVHLSEKLRAEAPGILNWLLEGCRKYLESGHITEPHQVTAATEEYLEEQDTFQQFLTECVILADNASKHDPKNRLRPEDLLSAYNKWAKTQGMQNWTIPTIKRNMKVHGLKTEKKNGKYIYLGMRLRSEAADIKDFDKFALEFEIED